MRWQRSAPRVQAIDWAPFAAALVMLAFVLLSLRRWERPGYFNQLLHPLFLVPLVLATVGVFVIRYLGANASDSPLLQTAQLPLPDWQRTIFGRGKLANPLFYSALIPLVVSFVAIKWRGIRPVVGGLSLGFAGFLAHAAWAKAPGLAYMPFALLAVPWLIANAGMCLLIARDDQEGPGMTLTGEIVFQDLEGGVWVLRADDGATYQLAGGDRHLKKNGQRASSKARCFRSPRRRWSGPVFRVNRYRFL